MVEIFGNTTFKQIQKQTTFFFYENHGANFGQYQKQICIQSHIRHLR